MSDIPGCYSPYKIVFGSLVLVEVGDFLMGDPDNILRLNPEFAGVEQVIFPGGDPKSFERNGTKNRWTTLELTVIRQHTTTYAALKYQLEHRSNIPPAGSDITITLDTYLGSLVIASAAILTASIHTVHHLSVTQYSIKGGKLTSTLALSANIYAEDGTALKDEAGVAVQQG